MTINGFASINPKSYVISLTLITNMLPRDMHDSCLGCGLPCCQDSRCDTCSSYSYMVITANMPTVPESSLSPYTEEDYGSCMATNWTIGLVFNSYWHVDQRGFPYNITAYMITIMEEGLGPRMAIGMVTNTAADTVINTALLWSTLLPMWRRVGDPCRAVGMGTDMATSTAIKMAFQLTLPSWKKTCVHSWLLV